MSEPNDTGFSRTTSDGPWLVYVPGDDDATTYHALESQAVACARALRAAHAGLNVHVCEVQWTTHEIKPAKHDRNTKIPVIADGPIGSAHPDNFDVTRSDDVDGERICESCLKPLSESEDGPCNACLDADTDDDPDTDGIAEHGLHAFWARIAESARKHYGIETGDLPPEVDRKLGEAAAEAVRAWFEANRPKPPAEASCPVIMNVTVTMRAPKKGERFLWVSADNAEAALAEVLLEMDTGIIAERDYTDGERDEEDMTPVVVEIVNTRRLPETLLDADTEAVKAVRASWEKLAELP